MPGWYHWIDSKLIELQFLHHHTFLGLLYKFLLLLLLVIKEWVPRVKVQAGVKVKARVQVEVQLAHFCLDHLKSLQLEWQLHKLQLGLWLLPVKLCFQVSKKRKNLDFDFVKFDPVVGDLHGFHLHCDLQNCWSYQCTYFSSLLTLSSNF